MEMLTVDTIKILSTPLFKKEGVDVAYIFGSYARREANSNSDIDFLVSFANQKSIFDIIKLEQELSDVCGKKVDIVVEQTVYEPIKQSIAHDAFKIYEAR